MKVTPSTRRHFIKTAATAVTAFNILPRHVLGGPRFVPPSEKVNLALIGAGGRGRQNIRGIFELADVQVTAIADPAEAFSLQAYYYKGTGGREPVRQEVEQHYAKKTPNFRCEGYEDFRVMLEKEKSIDAVLIATPDHTHAYITVACLRAGKHVYCEKPLTHNIWEAREVARVTKETGLATQMGNMGHSTVGIRETVEYLRAGAIGDVRDIHVWVPAKRWNPSLLSKPAAAMPMPDGLNWDLWIGPREPRSFHVAYHPVAWRDFWAFGTSAMGDFGCHDLDAATWAYELPAPSKIEANTIGPTDDEIAPHGALIRYDFAAQGAKPARRIHWYDGGARPIVPDALGGFPLPRRGIMFAGDKGVIQCDGAGGAPRLFPQSLRESTAKPAPSLKRSNGHHRDWIDACKGGAPASSHFEYGAHLTEISLLGVLAIRMGKPIQWDAKAMKAVGMPEADEIIRGTYRSGWEINGRSA